MHIQKRECIPEVMDKMLEIFKAGSFLLQAKEKAKKHRASQACKNGNQIGGLCNITFIS